MQQDQDQKNLLLAILLSLAVLIGWQFLYAGPKMKEEQERRARQQQEQTQLKGQPGLPKTETAPATPVPQGSTTPAPAPAASRAAALQASPRVPIETPSLRGSISLKGGRIDDIVLLKYRETVDPKSPNIVLFSPSGAPAPYYSEFGWVAGPDTKASLPGPDTVWRLEKGKTLTPDSPVSLVWDNGQGLVFRRTISVDANYMFTIVDEVENKSGAELALFPYALISRHGLPHTQGFYILHEGPIGVLGDAGLQELHYTDLLKEGGTKTFKQTGGWLGITDKYWGAALIPEQKTPYDAEFRGTKGFLGGKDRFQVGYALGTGPIAAGASASTINHLFAGAKQMSLIEEYQEKLGVKLFDRLIDWGWFWFITKPLFKLLHWLGQLFGNYGLAILATTVLVKLAFFPLANKSYESMAKMKKLQPEMERIRERYKDDRARQQQELMALYKNERINPLSGCLPVVLQIPVFFALYKVLFVTIDMRHAPFFGWIKDLSAPDPTSIFNLFGLLPYQPPDFLLIGVWPLIMGVTMWVQMQLNPQQPDPVQQKIFNWMPVMFTFLLASFPAGLVIYWAWNNVLSLIQQYYIMRRNGAEIHLWKNLGLEKWMTKAGAGQGVRSGSWRERMGTFPVRLPKSIGKLLKRVGTSAAESPLPDGPAKRAGPMTREEALRTLGLKPGASDEEIEAAWKRQVTARRPPANGSDHASTEEIDHARQILLGREGS
jgi:YidC/Oxa1 family membrane protein insertase